VGALALSAFVSDEGDDVIVSFPSEVEVEADDEEVAGCFTVVSFSAARDLAGAAASLVRAAALDEALDRVSFVPSGLA
jgi:hypothetical protein